MKITHNKVGQNLNLVDGAKTEKAGAGKQVDKKSSILPESAQDSGASKVDLSPRAQEAKRIKDIAMSAPDVDEAKVARFRKMIDEGTYKVDANAVADKMVDSHLETME